MRFGTILYEQAFIFKRALGGVVSSFRCRGVLSISATLQAAQPMFVRQSEQHASNFLDDQVNNIKSKFMYTSSVP